MGESQLVTNQGKNNSEESTQALKVVSVSSEGLGCVPNLKVGIRKDRSNL